MVRGLYLFYKDLNLHPSLRAIAKAHQLLPFFLWSEYLNQDVDDTPSLRYRLSLAKRFNDHVLPEGVNLLMGDDHLEEIINVCLLHHLEVVFMLKHFEPREKIFQEALAQGLAAHGIALTLLDGYIAVPTEKALKADGTPYQKFTPFYQNWLKHLHVMREAHQEIHWIEQPLSFDVPFDTHQKEVQGDFKGLSLFLTKGLGKYAQNRDFPYLNGTSRASALLNHGGVSVHDLLDYLLNMANQEHLECRDAFVRQLAWRDFYNVLCDRFPESLTENFSNRYVIPWQNNALDFQMWCSGQTGYPFVDAAMLHLFSTGRMHNRLRMVVSSFLTKYLLIDWREGAEWFKEHLIDYDLALNIGGWQWSASTGADAVPYFRVFNPIKQSEKYDAYGIFIKSEVELLDGVAPERIHEPLKHGVPYIAPCIDVKFARERVLNLYQKGNQDTSYGDVEIQE